MARFFMSRELKKILLIVSIFLAQGTAFADNVSLPHDRQEHAYMTDQTIWGNQGYMTGGPSVIPLSEEERIYLEKLTYDTWRLIHHLIDEQTGLPYDNIHRGEYTSVTNIGMGFAAVSGAYVMGYITKEEAVGILKQALDSMKKFKNWHGFCQSWNGVKSLQPSQNDFWVSTLDSGNLAGGMLIAKNTFPELSLDIEAYLNKMDWAWLYDAGTKRLLGGYITDKDLFAGPLNLLGGDPRLACFLAYAHKALDDEAWNLLDRNVEEKYGIQYFVPGWQGGGLFMQYISGLFMNEWASPVNRSAANFAYAQILHARQNKYPVWGWSASDSPKDGYLGWGHLKDDVVTPHASILTIAHYPKQVIQNLKALEEMGARAPYFSGGESHAYGFRDAIDIHTKQVTDNYLILDQGMVFLTLVNYLKRDALRGAVEEEKSISHAKSRLKDYHALREDEFKKILRLRDERPGDETMSELKIY